MNNKIEQCLGFIIHDYDLPYIYISLYLQECITKSYVFYKTNSKNRKKNVNNKSD